MFVTAFMDIEDIVNPDSDEAARDCAEILSQAGLRATMCVVGEKARLLLKRGRDDVIAALSEHDIALHSDCHSVHPTIAEAMEARSWDEGVDEAIQMEQPGVLAIERAFGRPPSCWAGPGNTWGPQLCDALKHLGLPAYAYGQTVVPDGGVHRFGGRIAYPNGPALSDAAYPDDAESERQRDVLAARLEAEAAAGMRWQQVFLGHPSRILHEEFWDAPNFAGGANPPRDLWLSARRRSEHDFRRALANFQRGVRMLASLPFIELCTIAEMNPRLARAASSPLTDHEINVVWPRIEGNLKAMRHWPIFPPDFYATNITALTRARIHTLERFH
jgi:hypothetical protein